MLPFKAPVLNFPLALFCFTFCHGILRHAHTSQPVAAASGLLHDPALNPSHPPGAPKWLPAIAMIAVFVLGLRPRPGTRVWGRGALLGLLSKRGLVLHVFFSAC